MNFKSSSHKIKKKVLNLYRKVPRKFRSFAIGSLDQGRGTGEGKMAGLRRGELPAARIKGSGRIKRSRRTSGTDGGGSSTGSSRAGHGGGAACRWRRSGGGTVGLSGLGASGVQD